LKYLSVNSISLFHCQEKKFPKFRIDFSIPDLIAS
jgi:hypothetical protein